MANFFERLLGNFSDDDTELSDFDDLMDGIENSPNKEEQRSFNRQETDAGASVFNRLGGRKRTAPQPDHRRVISMPGTTNPNQQYDQEVVVMVPYNFELTKRVCEYVKAGKTVICNIEKIDNETAQRVLDFLLGATYALSGTMESVSEKIFVVTPVNTHLNMRLGEQEHNFQERPSFDTSSQFNFNQRFFTNPDRRNLSDTNPALNFKRKAVNL